MPAPELSARCQAFSRGQRLLLAVLPPVGTVLIRLLCGTLRFNMLLEPEARPAYASKDRDIYVFWHRCLLLAAYRYRNLRIHILISQSFDGEIVARIVARLGFIPVRGSSSRGGAAGLLALSRAYRDGGKVAVTVDGPKGPPRIAKAGAASIAVNAATHEAAARRKGPGSGEASTITAFYLHPERAWTLKSWDGFLIPMPFTRVQCSWAAPLFVSANDSVPSVTKRMQTALEDAVTLAGGA